MQKIVIVGGGAGGLELASRLSRTLGRKKQAEITLVDRSRTHIWKPLLHEVAAGIIDKHSDGVDYAIHAAAHHYRFQLGELCAINAQDKTISLAPLFDEEGTEVLPQREIRYDELVLAIGSVSNDFKTPGVSQYCYFLDSLKQAERFHRALLNQLIRINQQDTCDGAIKVAIVGAGATGTELAAQLHHVANLSKAYGMPDMSASRLKITIVEAGQRILPALPERIANSARKALQKLGVDIKEQTMVAEADANGLITKDGGRIDADLMVWAAGVKAPDFIANMNLFETNRANQILVDKQLRSRTHSSIWVLGDCCGFQKSDGKWVPPRAQSAHQMAETVAYNIQAMYANKSLKEYTYKDYGSLVHLSKYSTVGSLMGSLSNSSMFVEGRLAKLVYVSLYNMHQFAVHGKIKGALKLLIKKLSNAISPKLKLH
ncbi:FAD-dependent oxidoreductase [Alteromonas sp. 345S023]|uniref:FAD-dependent oxidoreductase n=1 Tax=Alteromonas profundi TaxID=2696062 RepID=A0A7X5LNL0_9ALTE|nr:NAD(P)/FAD-dependent oxidoreductase [Alteromonas profundi]NDV92646.1 FAD-dependent oxidoreductase [Alteromonas profundi]